VGGRLTSSGAGGGLGGGAARAVGEHRPGVQRKVQQDACRAHACRVSTRGAAEASLQYSRASKHTSGGGERLEGGGGGRGGSACLPRHALDPPHRPTPCLRRPPPPSFRLAGVRQIRDYRRAWEGTAPGMDEARRRQEFLVPFFSSTIPPLPSRRSQPRRLTNAAATRAHWRPSELPTRAPSTRNAPSMRASATVSGLPCRPVRHRLLLFSSLLLLLVPSPAPHPPTPVLLLLLALLAGGQCPSRVPTLDPLSPQTASFGRLPPHLRLRQHESSEGVTPLLRIRGCCGCCGCGVLWGARRRRGARPSSPSRRSGRMPALTSGRSWTRSLERNRRTGKG